MLYRTPNYTLLALLIIWTIPSIRGSDCPPSEAILPCRCSQKGDEMQIWCSHSNLPQIMEGIKEIADLVKRPIDELILENNQLPSLPGRFFSSLQIARLMLRHNNVERLSTGWLTELEDTLVEIFIVERFLRSIPVESLIGFNNVEAITIQSEELKRLPDFSGMINLKYLSVQSNSLLELPPQIFRHLPKLQTIHINGGRNLNRLEAGLLDNLPSLKTVDLSRNGINWIHLRALYRLPNLSYLKLSDNQLSDVGMVGRVVKDLENLEKLRLDRNYISALNEGSFVDLPMLRELHLNDNRITEIQYGSFHRTRNLRLVYLQNNRIKRIHPESFLQSSGSGVESLYLEDNEINRIEELKSLLDALPTLKFLDMSSNFLSEIPFGALRGHGTIEQLHLDNNAIQTIDRDALMAMPALRELRLRNNSLSEMLPMPFWNLPGLKGLDLSFNQFRTIDSALLNGVPSLRRLDLSQNSLISLDPSSFLNTPMLETLNISFNDIDEIDPSTFRSLDRLFEIDASYNHFQGMIPGLPKIVERVSMRGNQIASLPIAASKSLNLPNLRMLDISHNSLEYLPKFTFQSLKQLRVLSLANNRLRAIEDSTFLGTSRLEMLHLQDNQIAQIQDKSLQLMDDLRDFNLQGNKIEMLNDHLFVNSSHLEQLDLSRNNIQELTPMIFKNLKSLKFLDLSGNVLVDVPDSLSQLTNLQDIDISFNRLAFLPPQVLGSWRNVIEIRMSNNQIVELKHGTLRNLPKLQYLDLSSNEISSLEPGALRNLPDLQELVLADNKITDIKDHVFEDLPNLQATHLQHNLLRFISPDSFFKSPSLVYLNLSSNHFRTMENVGLRSMRNLEVLDMTGNNVRSVSTMPLQALNWLVELTLDDNQICKIQGSPFETMPRLRVLSLRNNRMKTMSEKTFRNLRGNIAVLDIDGNPILCSCEMLWLSVWLDETNSPNPGPMCQNGKMLRAARLDKNDCDGDSRSTNLLPLMNEHGDVFLRQINGELDEECDSDVPEEVKRPLPGESEYFYDQYIDFPANESITPPSNSIPDRIQGKPTQPTPAPINLNNTLLNYNLFKNTRPPIQQSSSPFTFFGYPLPSLFGSNNRKSNARSQGLPPTRGKVRMYRPTDAEFEKYLNQETQFHDITSRNRFTEQSSSEGSYPGSFRTPFQSPQPQQGGFSPYIPEAAGGFVPIRNPYEGFAGRNESRVDSIPYSEEEHNVTATVRIPLITEPPRITSFITPANEFHSLSDVQDTTTYQDEMDAEHEEETYAYQGDTVVQTTTESLDGDPVEPTSLPETILLIPPTSELEGQTAQRYHEDAWTGNSKEDFPSRPRQSLGKSTITKVFTPQSPTAEEYFRTTMNADASDNDVQSNEVVTTTYVQSDEQTRKHGMEWYYDNYKTGGNKPEGLQETKSVASNSKGCRRSSNDGGSFQISLVLALMVALRARFV